MGTLKNCLIFVSGAAIGAGSVWFIMNRKLNDQTKEMSDKIQEGIDQYIEARTKSEKNSEMKGSIPIVGSIDTMSFPTSEESVVPHSIWDTISEPDNSIHQISFAEYDANEEDPHISLTYFAADDMVATSDHYVVIEDPEDVLGNNFRELVGDADGGEAIYISNDNEESMYEVIINKYESLSDIIEEKVDEDIEAYAAEG